MIDFKNKNILGKILIGLVIFSIVCSYFGFKYYKKIAAQNRLNKNIQQISDSALKVKVSEDQKLQSINELSSQSSEKISPEEASKREAEIINQLNSK
ncbi:MAG: hypothetical protein NTX85_00845 [Candidatus Nomurabacteria bacterium]|nr:hypothetical protein [Candidatus Nomurabacteria bacterium]